MKFDLTQGLPLIREVLDSGGEFQLVPQGVSMLPLIRPGKDSVTLVKPAGPLRAGEIILYSRPDRTFVLHRIISVQAHSYTLCGDHQVSLEAGVRNEDIVAVVARIRRGDRLLDDSCLTYRLYQRLWHSFTFRRVFFRLSAMIRRLRRKGMDGREETL